MQSCKGNWGEMKSHLYHSLGDKFVFTISDSYWQLHCKLLMQIFTCVFNYTSEIALNVGVWLFLLIIWSNISHYAMACDWDGWIETFENKYSENAKSCKNLFIMYINKYILFNISPFATSMPSIVNLVVMRSVWFFFYVFILYWVHRRY